MHGTEIEYIYDLPLPPQSSPDYLKPRPHDDEVESFAVRVLPFVLFPISASPCLTKAGSVLFDPQSRIKGSELTIQLMNLNTVREHLFAGDFKPNCGAILVDFLMRHGLLSAENEPKLLEIRWGLARRLGLAMPN